MEPARRAKIEEILEALPGGPSGVEHLSTAEAQALNEQIMNRCCYRERLVTSFIDALREPTAAIAQAEGWRRLADFIPMTERERVVYLAADLHGFFRLPASRVPEVLDSTLWTHEIYVVGGDVDWLVGFKDEHVFLQGRAAPKDDQDPA